MSLAAPNADAAEILLRVYHGSGVTRAELTSALEVRAGVVKAALDAFTDAGLIVFQGLGYYPSMNASAGAARREYARLSGARTCRTCGCTDQWACEGGCDWVDEDLCSTCDPTIMRLNQRTSFVVVEDDATYIETELADDECVRLNIRRGESVCAAVLTPSEAIAVATKLLMYASAAENDGELL